MRRHLLHVSIIVAVALAASWAADSAHAQPAAPPRPNIIIILADDLGYSDIGCYGGEIRTPNLDALATRGLRFTQFYNAARCCPTRASLMTGLYPHQAGVGQMTIDAGLPGYRGFLTPNTVTLAELLRAAGYRTGMVGKWHLSVTRELPGHMKHLSNQVIRDTFSDPATYPIGRGFDFHYGVIWGVVNFFDPFSLVRGAEPVRQVPADYYITDALTDEAIQFIQGADPAQPFFLYVSHTAPHWPLHALQEDIARYADTYNVGWDAIRQARHGRMLDMGLLPANQPTLSPPLGRNTSWEDNPTRQWDARAMAVHAAMIDRMDQGVGRIVEALRQSGRLDNTLILFLSDNGASPEAYPDPGFDRPAETRDGRKITYPPNKSILPGPEETFFGFGPRWANVSNTPFRYWKAELYEGGICTPLIAYWPGGMPAQAAGAITHEPGHVMDLMATCLDLAGAAYPARFDGRRITPIAGKSLVPTLRGQQRDGHELLAWEHFGARAIREGAWKLVARRDAPWELYDLAKDRSELTDLAPANPEKVRELETRWQRWADSTNVLPAPGANRPAPRP